MGIGGLECDFAKDEGIVGEIGWLRATLRNQIVDRGHVWLHSHGSRSHSIRLGIDQIAADVSDMRLAFTLSIAHALEFDESREFVGKGAGGVESSVGVAGKPLHDAL